ncbi:MAG: AI-2E family transporter [Acidobacteria bacterium]|nr:AI-2E family transporter [Acidobacteriota bacterium]
MAILSSGSSARSKPRGLGVAVIATAAAIGLLYFGRVFLITFVIAVILSLILEPFVGILVRFRVPRPFASFLVCSTAILILYLGGLGAYSQLSGLVTELPAYSGRLNEMVDAAAEQIEQAELATYRLILPKKMQHPLQPPKPQPSTSQSRRRRTPDPLPILPPPPTGPLEVRITPERSPLIDYVYNHLEAVYSVLLMSSFVPFLVYFMLSWRDHVRRSFLQLFQGTDRLAAGKSWEGIAEMGRAYVVGNFLLGLLISAASTIFFWIVKLPYFPLVGPLSGFLSLVPYIGLPLALIPPLFAALPVYNRLPPYLIIATSVAFFHLLALNLLYPKIVGARVHLNPLIVTLALMFWGTMWGGIGLVLAIPITAGVKAVCDNVESLQAYGRLLGD